MSAMINIDVPDLGSALEFYTQAFNLKLRRHLAGQIAELAGWPVAVFLLQKEDGSIGAGSSPRTYERHWTPVHLDVVVDDIDEALARAVRVGAVVEHEVRTHVWGKIAVLADPYGHGFCLVQFINGGYGEITVPSPVSD